VPLFSGVGNRELAMQLAIAASYAKL